MNHPCFADIAARVGRIHKAFKDGNLKPEDARWVGENYVFIYKSEGHGPGTAAKLGLGRSGSAEPLRAKDFTDKYTIPFTITVLQVDRDGDVVKPLGAHFQNFGRSPGVFFGHQELAIPIGQARDTAGRVLFWPEERRIRSACRFDEHDPDAMFVYNKVIGGFLNSSSMAFVPERAWKRDRDKEKGMFDKADPHRRPDAPAGWFFDEYDVTEWSIVGVASNAGALRDILDQEKSFMSPKLQKGFGLYTAKSINESGGCFTGWDGTLWCPVGKAVEKQCGCKDCQDGKECPCHAETEEKADPGSGLIKPGQSVGFVSGRQTVMGTVQDVSGSRATVLVTSFDRAGHYKEGDKATVALSSLQELKSAPEPVHKEGPFFSQWSGKPHYLTPTAAGFVVTMDGEEVGGGHVFASMNDALGWLRNNGFTMRPQQPDSDRTRTGLPKSLMSKAAAAVEPGDVVWAQGGWKEVKSVLAGKVLRGIEGVHILLVDQTSICRAADAKVVTKRKHDSISNTIQVGNDYYPFRWEGDTLMALVGDDWVKVRRTSRKNPDGDFIFEVTKDGMGGVQADMEAGRGQAGEIDRTGVLAGEPKDKDMNSTDGPAGGYTVPSSGGTTDKDLPSEHADVSPEKARQILHDGEVNGHPLTDAQRGMFGAIASRGKAMSEFIVKTNKGYITEAPNVFAEDWTTALVYKDADKAQAAAQAEGGDVEEVPGEDDQRVSTQEAFTVKPSMKHAAMLYQNAQDEDAFNKEGLRTMDHEGMSKGLKDYHDKFITKRMQHLKDMLHKHHGEGYATPDDLLAKITKGMETDDAGAAGGSTGEAQMVDAGHTPPKDADTEEILAREQDPGTKKFFKKRVGYVRRGLDGCLYLVEKTMELEPQDRGKAPYQTAKKTELEDQDRGAAPYNKALTDGDVACLKEASDYLDGMSDDDDVPKHYRVAAKSFGRQLGQMHKALTQAGKIQADGGRGQTLSDKGKVQSDPRMPGTVGGGTLDGKGEIQANSGTPGGEIISGGHKPSFEGGTGAAPFNKEAPAFNAKDLEPWQKELWEKGLKMEEEAAATKRTAQQVGMLT